jgi:hypothetical protein
VSLLTIDKGEFRVLATAGDTHLGGSDFDQRIMEYFIKRFKMKEDLDLSKSPRAIARLRKEAEAAKRVLSEKTQVSVPRICVLQIRVFTRQCVLHVYASLRCTSHLCASDLYVSLQESEDTRQS